jgi:DNA-binding XRE family transcriptional regulator
MNMDAQQDANVFLPMERPEMLTGRQCAAARALARVPQLALADRAGVNLRTLIDFENDRRRPREETKVAIARALEASGVVFIGKEGVALRAA